MLNRLREVFDFSNPETSRDKHREDHLALHQAYNDAARMYRPKASASENSANLKAALADSISGTLGRTLIIPPQTYNLDDVFPIQNVLGLRVVGYGGQTRLVSRKNADSGSLFDLSDVRESTFRDLNIWIDAPLFCAFRTRNKAGGTVPSFNLFENIRAESSDKLTHGIQIGSGEPDTIDANNDFHVFRRFYLGGYTSAGAFLRGSSQAYNNAFENCLFYGGTGAQYGVNAGGNYPGSFHWRGGFLHNHAAADFIIGRHYQPFIIEGACSEGSARFLVIDNAAHTHVLVRGVRYAANSLHADGRAVIASGRYRAMFELNRFGDGSNGVPIKFDFNTTVNGTTQAWVKFTGNDIYSPDGNVWINAVPTLEGNWHIPNEANHGSGLPLTA